MPYWILFEIQVLEFICNIYCIELFILNITKFVFAVDLWT
jgi:hypothetical protein